MDIERVTNAIKVGDFILRNDDSPNHIDIRWLPEIGNDILRDESGRVYIMTSNGIIKKIGGSQSRGGLRATISFYVSSMQGRPSIRSYGIHLLIKGELERGNRVELYVIRAEKVYAPIVGLFDTEEGEVSPFKEMENKCKADFLREEENYPEWNFQERGQAWPLEIQRSHEDQRRR
ncbi:MAG: hypothetical protein ACFFBY_07835 [Promethearchaeota archaeon]